MTDGFCIDCRDWTPLILAERFPHICHGCLFPPRKIGEDFKASAPEWLPVPTMLQKLQQMNKNTGSIAPDQNRMGGG